MVILFRHFAAMLIDPSRQLLRTLEGIAQKSG